MSRKKINKDEKKDEKIEQSIDKLLIVINDAATQCRFWRCNEPYAHIMGIRPVKRTTLEVINKNGFNPYNKETEENLFKSFIIYISPNENENTLNKEEIQNKKHWEDKGYIYLKHHDLLYIYEFIRNNK